MREFIPLVLFIVVLSASAQPSKHPPNNNAQISTQPAASDKRGTEETPLAAKILPAKDAEPKAAEEKQERDKKAATDDRLVQWTHALFLATVALAFIAAAQVGFFWWQLLLMRDGVNDAAIAAGAAQKSAEVAEQTVAMMKQTAQRQLRAYTLLYFISINNVATPRAGLVAPENNIADVNFPNIGPRFHVEIRNSGQTPAYDVIHWTHAEFREFPLQSPLSPRPKMRGINVSRITLGPEDKGTRDFSFPVRLTDQQILQLCDGTHAIYVYGGIFYKDAFNRRRKTKYCYFHAEGAPGHIGISTTFNAYQTGNSAT